MARHYSTKDFFRQMPNALLARYFLGQIPLVHLCRAVILGAETFALHVAPVAQERK